MRLQLRVRAASSSTCGGRRARRHCAPQWMKCTGRPVGSAAASMAIIGVMPTPPLISTSGCSLGQGELARRREQFDHRTHMDLVVQMAETLPPASRLTLMRYCACPFAAGPTANTAALFLAIDHHAQADVLARVAVQQLAAILRGEVEGRDFIALGLLA
jgi:hypothetical protein